ncbi:MAG TPA: homoserine kinase [Actinomycetota bacterium]|nr:homoserine kinase [Actinomycetota bacterium]
MTAVVVRVPATIANLGPGFDALGLALEWHNEVRVEQRDDDVLVVTGTGSISDNGIPRDESNLVVRALRTVVGKSGLAVNQIVAIPNGRGFGSSAAAVIAGLVAGRALSASSDSDEQLLAKAIELEGHADNAAPCLLGGITVSAGSSTIRIDPPASIRPLVCVAPNAMPTEAARAALAKEIARSDAVSNIGRASLLVAALTEGRSDVLMDATEDALHQPARFELMPDSGALVRAMRAHGIAAFLSGAGPSVAALVDETSASASEKTAKGLAPEGWDVRLESFDPLGARIVSERDK